ncbi:hypothetical protein B7985_12105 [Staphylococcus aureus]|nr:hypothetical protein B7985_12105 [Staphylococcus aureus]
MDQAQTNSQVNQAATNGVSAIKIIQPETKVKPAAREKINQKANELRAKINQDKEASQDKQSKDQTKSSDKDNHKKPTSADKDQKANDKHQS